MPESAPARTETSNAGQRHACGLGRRLLVMAYDTVAVVVLLMAVTAVALFTPLGRQTAFRDPLPTLLFFLTWFFYLAWCWRQGGLTLGMRAWKVRLVFKDGKTPGWGRCLLRFVISLLSAAALGMGFIWCLFNEERRSWHDLATASMLVRSPAASNRSA